MVGLAEHMDYERDSRTVVWSNYRSGSVEIYDARDFLARVETYRWRMGQDGDKRTHLYRRYGYMAKGSVHAAVKALGGTRQHREGCACRKCHDWRRI